MSIAQMLLSSVPTASGPQVGNFVAVGGTFQAAGKGASLCSADGITWDVTTGLSNTINWSCVTYGNDIYVALGYGSNQAAYSLDGITWTQTTMPVTANWQAIAYGNGLFVATIINSTQIYTSPNGINWTVRAGANTAAASITFGNGRFIAIHQSISIAQYSTNGINWTSATPQASANNITFFNGLFVAVGASGAGNIYQYTTDGITWTLGSPVPSLIRLQAVAGGNGIFAALPTSAGGSQTGVRSVDGINWTVSNAVPQPSPGSSYYTMVYGSGKFIAAGTTNTNRFIYSTNGITWIQITVPTTSSWQGIATRLT